MRIQHVYELFALDGQTFITEVYRNLLKREPDEHGMAYYLGRLAMGDSKASIITQIVRSQEFGSCGQEVKGLKKLVTDESLSRYWILGWFINRRRANKALLSSVESIGRISRQTEALNNRSDSICISPEMVDNNIRHTIGSSVTGVQTNTCTYSEGQTVSTIVHIEDKNIEEGKIVLSDSMISISGFIVGDIAVEKVLISVSNKLALTNYGIPRRDVFEQYKNNPNGINVGYSAYIDALAPGDHELVYEITKIGGKKESKIYNITVRKSGNDANRELSWAAKEFYKKCAIKGKEIPIVIVIWNDAISNAGVFVNKKIFESLQSIKSEVAVVLPHEMTVFCGLDSINAYRTSEELSKILIGKIGGWVIFVNVDCFVKQELPDVIRSMANDACTMMYWDDIEEDDVDSDSGKKTVNYKTPGAPFITELFNPTLGYSWAVAINECVLEKIVNLGVKQFVINYPLAMFLNQPQKCLHIAEVLMRVPKKKDRQSLHSGARSVFLNQMQCVYKNAHFREIDDDHLIPNMLYSEWSAAISKPRVSVIIPTNGSNKRVEKILFDLKNKTNYQNIEIIVLDHTLSNPGCSKDTVSQIRKFADVIIPCDGPFNWSKFNNIGAKSASGDVYFFLNDDVEVLSGDWIDRLIDIVNIEKCGVVGPRLLFPDQHMIQSFGVSLLPHYGWAVSDFSFCSKNDRFHDNINYRPRNCSAVLGAAICVRSEVFHMVNGFNEYLPITFNDLDFCNRVRLAGYQVVVTPYFELIHHEKNSRANIEEMPMESNYWQQWKALHYNKDCYWHDIYLSGSASHELDPEPIERVLYAGIYGYRNSVKSILLFKLDHIGDFIQAIPAFYLLKRSFPAAEIDIILGPWNASIAQAIGIFRKIFTFDFYMEKSGEGRKADSGDAEVEVKRILGDIYYDIAIDYRSDGDTRYLLKTVSAKVLAGFSKSMFYPWLDISVEWEGNVSLWRKNLNGSLLLKRMSQAVIDAFLEGDDQSQFYKIGLHDNFISSCIVIHPFAGNDIKMWPEDYWVSLCSSLSEEVELPVIVIGSLADKSGYNSFIKKLKNVGVIDYVGEISIVNLPGFIANAACFIGVDSGPKHLAALIGIPTIAIQSGFVDPVVWAPMNAPGLSVIKKVFCSPCYLDDIRLCSENHRCMRGIYPGDIIRILKSFGFLKRNSSSLHGVVMGGRTPRSG
ncbi:glycosyltransferase family 9 protein [Acidithiobacillus sp.]|uniref:glycosyltransferase family 9 protein n=1 Tax=Acidithiobacillus sp. TaxID=1872118 RepID=UPI0023187FD1|nr:glycosyltransferase family 9 protein [Acidithiobacillus sp.]MDA8245679.1 DUF4214 domain-containing protein [Acidithiobacillus sp.]